MKAREKFEKEEAEDRKLVVEEAINALRERHDLEMCQAIDRYIMERKEASYALPDQGVVYSVSGGGEK